MCALRAVRPTGATPQATVVNQGSPAAAQATSASRVQQPVQEQPQSTVQEQPQPQQTTPANVPATQESGALAAAGTVQDLNAGILDNIDGMGNAGNFVTMDGSEFLYKSDNTVTPTIDLIVSYGKRYYQWVEEDGEQKTYHDSDTKLDNRYKLKFEIHWMEDAAEGGEPIDLQFHAPTASAMRLIDYIGQLAKAGFGIGGVVTQMSISRQVRQGYTDRYSRAEFTMVGVVNPDGTITAANPGITTVNKK